LDRECKRVATRQIATPMTENAILFPSSGITFKMKLQSKNTIRSRGDARLVIMVHLRYWEEHKSSEVELIVCVVYGMLFIRIVVVPVLFMSTMIYNSRS
jgi:hypothetical protein